MSKYDGMLDLPWFEDENRQKFYYADEVNQRIAALETALRQLREWVPKDEPGIFRSGVGTQLLDRIDVLLGTSVETSVQPTVEQRAKQLFLSMHGITEGLWEAQSEIEKDKWRGHIAASQSKTKGDAT